MEVTYVPNPQKADGRPVVFTTALMPTEVLRVFTPVKLNANVNGYDPVTVTGILADSNNPATFGRLLGVTETGGSAGTTIFVYVSGHIYNPDWNWTPGGVIFLFGTSLAQQMPTSGYLQQIGMSITPKTIEIRIHQAIQL
jgi:hypothetical protein